MKNEVYDLKLCIEFIKEYGFLPNNPPAKLFEDRANLNLQIRAKEKEIEESNSQKKVTDNPVVAPYESI